jgi:MFS family permease
MAIHVRHPILISAPQAGAWTFSLLFFLESTARAILATVLPLTAYALFNDDKSSVSLIYTGVSLIALALSFAIPALVRRLTRRWTYTLGCALFGLCALLLTLDAQPALVVALLARTTGTALLSVTLSLYIMDNIGKRELTRSEPLRLAVSTLAWGVLPFVGVWLMQRYGIGVPAGLSIAAITALAGVFWVLRLAEGGPIRKAVRVAPLAGGPIARVRRFAAQPRLRLAWAIAFGRSAFWVTLFTYVPILMVEGGLSASAGGLAVAAANLMLFNNLFARGWATRHSLRRVLGGAYLTGAALVLVAAALSPAAPAAAAIAMVAAAFFMAIIDGLGPVPVLRAVRVHERPEMATVYRTYLDASELLPQAAYFVLFMIGGFAAAFAGLAAAMATIGWLTLRHLPRGMR